MVMYGLWVKCSNCGEDLALGQSVAAMSTEELNTKLGTTKPSTITCNKCGSDTTYSRDTLFAQALDKE
jgi:hypothetical protein